MIFSLADMLKGLSVLHTLYRAKTYADKVVMLYYRDA